jgi:hypothetical protein
MEHTYDWLPERIARMRRVARELDLELTWRGYDPATDAELDRSYW